MSGAQIWPFEDWGGLPLGRIQGAALHRSGTAPVLGDLSVRDLMVQALAGEPHPVGIYILFEGEQIMYAGKTHGRSLAERMITHLDSRTPSGTGWSMSCAAAAMVHQGLSPNRVAAVDRLMEMRVLWAHVPTPTNGRDHQHQIAVIENRLKWAGALDPTLVSARDRQRSYFTVGGYREIRQVTTIAGS